MHFFVRKRRQTPTVIIVALVDVLIVLLIFLMVTTTFKQQPALKLALPESSHAEKTSARDTVPLIISIDAQGNLLFGDDKVPVTADSLKAVSYTHLRAHETRHDLVCRLLLEKKKKAI